VTSLVVDNIDDTNDGDYSTGKNTLREAIANANAGDTITFASSGTITLTSQLTIDKDLTIDGSGKNITISGNNAVRVFEVSAGTVTFESLTIANGKTTGIAGAGGGIWNKNGNITVINSTFDNNVAANSGSGGAIRNEAQTFIENSTFINNSAEWGGGCISNEGALTIKNSTFSGGTSGDVNGSAIINGTLGTVYLSNTILANKTNKSECFNIAPGTISTNINNLIEDNTCSPALSGDPKLGPLQDNGGDTQTMAL
jgi:hypothetical protein